MAPVRIRVAPILFFFFFFFFSSSSSYSFPRFSSTFCLFAFFSPYTRKIRSSGTCKQSEVILQAKNHRIRKSNRVPPPPYRYFLNSCISVAFKGRSMAWLKACCFWHFGMFYFGIRMNQSHVMERREGCRSELHATHLSLQMMTLLRINAPGCIMACCS